MDDVKFLVSGGTIAPLSGLEGRCPKVLSAISTSYASHAHRDTHIRMVDRACSGDDHARRRVVGLDVVHEVLALNSTPHASLMMTTS